MPRIRPTKLADVVKLGRDFFNLLGAEVVDRIVIHTRDGGKDHRGRMFKPLNPKYKEYKATTKKRGRDQSSPAKANIWFSGETMLDLQRAKVNDKSVTLNWPSRSDVLRWNEKNGRVVTSKSNPVAPGIERYIQKQIDKRTKKNIRKNDTKTTYKL